MRINLALQHLHLKSPLFSFLTDILPDQSIDVFLHLLDTFAVSYTHLDVYKRQDKRRASNIITGTVPTV